MIILGPFSLERTIGRGGMGEVWRARHQDRRQVVAVKVLTSAAAQDPFFLAAFRNEARAAAGLTHPNIATVFDYGQIPAETEAASGGELRGGSPYLVMEMAAGGSLDAHLGRLEWRQLRVLLLCLLDALAHAHARGVVHRDMKPANALLAGRWSAVKLTDFGLAHAFGGEHTLRDEEGAVGTPAYMAPEQFESNWRDFGPWTDLYGLGCMAFALACGHPPFGPRPHTQRAMASHLHLPAPELTPACTVPAGFQDWVATLLEKEPGRRFLRAADAAWVLRRLEPAAETDPVWSTPPPVISAIGAADTVAMARPPGRGPVHTGQLDPPEPMQVHLPVDLSKSSGFPAPCRVPPMPATWRRPAGWDTESAPARLIRGVGLGLFGLRTLNLVGRESERDLLWEALSRVRRVGRARALVVQGPTGCGKTRLVDWLCERAHELGAATVFRGTANLDDSGGDVVAAMIGRSLHVRGLSAPDLRRRLGQVTRHDALDPAEADALVQLLAPSPPDAEPGMGPDRLGVARRFLERAARDRPALVVLEDVHRGLGPIEFAQHLLEAQVFSAAPILLVLTAREDALSERPEEAAALADVLQRPDARVLEIGPLPPPAFSELLRVQLGLAPELAARVELRAAGNPRFAVDLVGDWAQRGALVVADTGLRLAGDQAIDLPDDLFAGWEARLSRVLEGRAHSDGVALELAAVLGLEVDGREWREACARRGSAPPWDLVENMLSWRLIRCEPTGPWASWSFTSSILREALSRRARAAGRWASLHADAAAVLSALSQRQGNLSLADTERLGRHLVEAGALPEALDQLLQAAEARYNAGELVRCAALLEERERAVGLLGLGDSDPRVAEGWVLWSRCAADQGKTDLASAYAARADKAAAQNGWLALRASALMSCAEIANRLGDGHEAVVLMEEARRFALASGGVSLLASCRVAQARVLLSHGLTEEAARGFARASREFESEGDARGAALCWVGLGRVSATEGIRDEAMRHAQRARKVFVEIGARAREAEALALIGDVHWQGGDLVEAQRAWEEGTALLQALQSREALLIEARVALAEIGRARFAEARQILESARQKLERRGMRKRTAALRVWLLPCCAADADWRSFDAHLSAAGDLLQETGYVAVDVARLAAWGGDLAFASGQAGRARLAWTLALEQWLVLGWEDEISGLQKLLGADTRAPTGEGL